MVLVQYVDKSFTFFSLLPCLVQNHNAVCTMNAFDNDKQRCKKHLSRQTFVNVQIMHLLYH